MWTFITQLIWGLLALTEIIHQQAIFIDNTHTSKWTLSQVKFTPGKGVNKYISFAEFTHSWRVYLPGQWRPLPLESGRSCSCSWVCSLGWGRMTLLGKCSLEIQAQIHEISGRWDETKSYILKSQFNKINLKKKSGQIRADSDLIHFI